MALWTFIAAVAGTSFLSGIMGMAGGMILMGVLASELPVAAAMTLHGATQVTSNGARAWLFRSAIHWRGVLNYALGLVFAVAVFAQWDFIPPKRLIYLGLGILPFLGLLVPKSLSPDFSRPWQQPLCGFLVGMVQMLAGASGAALDIFFVRGSLTKNETLATKGMTQVLGHGAKLAYYATITGESPEFTFSPVWIAAAVIAAVVGTRGGALVAERLNEQRFRTISGIAIVLIGVVYLVKAATGA